MSESGGWRLGHRPALDGLRGLAVLAVMLHHAGVLPAGYVGVEVFFALSGFLITSLLLEERARLGRIRLRVFYVRRLRRLAPALVLVVAFAAALGPALGSRWTGVGAASTLLYVSNFAMLDGQRGALTHTWSLAIEEQFYLAWPLVLIVVARWGRSAIVGTAVALTAAATAWAYILPTFATYEHLVYMPDARAAPILAGCALAAWMHGRPEGPGSPRLAGAALLALAALAVVPVPGPLWVTAASVALLWSVTQGRELRLLRDPVLRWIGVRSYGLYLWHFPLVVLVTFAPPTAPFGVLLPLALIVSFVAAELSYRFVEEPFRRGRPSRVHAAAPVAVLR